MSDSIHQCPICNTSLEKWERYPRYVCEDCIGKATDSTGRILLFSNIDFAGGFIAKYKDTGKIYDSNSCFIDGVRCHADEARFGGIVVQKR